VSLIGLFSTIVALVDSGATMNFINECIVATLGLETEPCAPTRVVLADGRVLAHSNRQITLKFTIAGITQTQTFLVAPIGIHSIILGMPWLEHTNPTIDWRLKTVQFGVNLPSSPNRSEIENSPETTEIEIVPAKPEITPSERVKKKKKQKSKPRHPPPQRPPPPIPAKVRLTTKINSNDEVYVLHLDGIVCLSEYLSAAHEEAQNNLPPIPKEYEDLAEVFSKKKAHELPPHRGPLDHHIDLEEGSKPVFGPIYNLSETELQVLKEYIDENP
jgi:hypothetical protein